MDAVRLCSSQETFRDPSRVVSSRAAWGFPIIVAVRHLVLSVSNSNLVIRHPQLSNTHHTVGWMEGFKGDWLLYHRFIIQDVANIDWLAALDRKRIRIPSSYRNKFQIIIHFVVWVGVFGCVLQERFITCCTANHPSFIFTGCNCHSRMWRVLHGWCGSVHNLGTFVIQELFK